MSAAFEQKEHRVESPKTQFVLKGFTEIKGFRVFVFEEVKADWTRIPVSVRTDLALTRRYGIPLQELPLLCRAVLERRIEGEEKRAFTYTEEDMCGYADRLATRQEAASKKKPPRRPAPDRTGAAWRVPPR